MKKFSIVICTYNGEETIKYVLKRILELDGIDSLVDKIIIVDNASTDQTKKVIKEFEKKNSLIKYEYEEKPGLSNARKHSIFCNTEWVVFLDDDNLPSADWLIKMNDNIIHNPSVGVANSACVAVPEGVFTDDELMKLDIISPNIACTHSSIDDYLAKKKAKMNRPFGAGMFVKTSELIKLNEMGWTKNVGRTKDNLCSGEDGEIATFVLSHGFSFMLYTNTYIEHLIPRTRVQDLYIDKLYRGLLDGFVVYLESKKHPLIRKILSFVKSILLIPLLLFLKYFSFAKKARYKAALGYKVRKYLVLAIIR